MTTRYLTCVLWLSTLTTTSIAVAQETAAVDRGLIDEIYVTATRREQSLGDVPISMIVVTKEQLERFNIGTLDDLQYSVPNFFVGRSIANNGFYLRGFGSAPNNFAFDQTVAMYQDGIYAGRGRQFMAPFFDVERIEVLRGPQGALLGKNTAAGAISVVTANPTREFDASVTASYNFERSGVETFAHISGPLSDTVSARLAVKYSSVDGYVKNIATGQDDGEIDERLARLTLLYAPDDQLTITGKLQVEDFSIDGSTVVHVAPNQPLKDTLSAAIKAKDTVGAFGQRAFDEQTGFNASVTADYVFENDYTLTYVTGYSAFDSDRLGPPGYDSPGSNFRAQWSEDFKQYSQELRLLSPTGRTLEFIAGLYADAHDYSMLNHSEYELFFATGLTIIDFEQTSKTYSGYVNATWNISDSVSLLSSARFTRNEKTGNYTSTVTGQALPGQGARQMPTTDINENQFDPSITLQYRPNPNWMLYVSYAEGSKSGAFESVSRSVVPESFTTRAEESKNYEIGAKATPLDWLAVDLAIFQLEFDDLQVAAFDPVLAQSITRNAASARSRGVETTVLAHIGPHFDISAALSYLDAEYTDFPGATCTHQQPSPPCTPATNNIKGFAIPFSSKWSGQLRASFRQPIGRDLALRLDGTMGFRSRLFIDQGIYNPDFGTQKAYRKFNARVEVGSMDERWTVALIGTNLTNEITGSQSYFWPLQPPPTAGVAVGEPRHISLQGVYRF